MNLFKIGLLFVLTTCSSAASNVTTIELKRHHKHDGSLEGLGHHLRNVRSVNGGAEFKLRDFQDMYYYAEVKIGTPGQTVLVEFDTGSADLWVPSSKICKKNEDYCQQHKTYSHKDSTTYEKNGDHFSIKFGSGSVSGFISKDKLSVGSLHLSSQEFGEATSINDNTASHKYDGILGLAYPSLSRLSVDPPFVSMYKQGVVSKHVFAFHLSKQSSGWSSSGKAELVLGGVDSAHYKGDFTFASVTKREHWMIKIDSLQLGSKQVYSSYNAMVDSGTSFLYGPSKAIEAINKALNGTYEDVYFLQLGSKQVYSSYNAMVDSGTSFLYGPSKAIEAINKALNGTYEDVYLYVDCSHTKNFPEVSYVISGKKFVLHPSDYIFKVHDEHRCISAFIGFYDLSFFVLGDVFMRKFYTQFDMANNRVGFATAK